MEKIELNFSSNLGNFKISIPKDQNFYLVTMKGDDIETIKKQIVENFKIAFFNEDLLKYHNKEVNYVDEISDEESLELLNKVYDNDGENIALYYIYKSIEESNAVDFAYCNLYADYDYLLEESKEEIDLD